MATLWKRATEDQYRMLRAVAGAVRNTAHAHQVQLPYNFDRSVAKRAAGTLSAAERPEALATETDRRQEGVGETSVPSPRPRTGSRFVKGRSKGGHLTRLRWSPLHSVWKQITSKMWQVTDPAAREAYIDVLRLLAKEQERLKQ